MEDTTYKVPDNPVYSPKIREIQDEDPVKASEVLTPVMEQIIENIHAVHLAAKEAGAGAAQAVPKSEKGTLGGVATLDGNGKVPAAQLPDMDYDAAGSAEAVRDTLNAHTTNESNPHKVTAEQVGADPSGSAEAIKSLLETALREHTEDTTVHLSSDSQPEWEAVIQALQDHIDNQNNPHNVTSTQVGAEPGGSINSILEMLGMGILHITARHADGTPYSNLLISGITGIATSRCYTNEDGILSLCIDEGTFNLKPNVPNYIDVTMEGQTAKVKTGQTTTVVLEQKYATTSKYEIKTTQNIMFSHLVDSVDVFCVGGGGGGGYPTSFGGTKGYYYGPTSGINGGGGGGGGYVNTRKSVSFTPDTTYTATIGAGGTGGDYYTTTGGSGGTTSFMGVSASGGAGGSSTASTRYQTAAGGSGGSGGGAGGYIFSSTKNTGFNEAIVDKVEASSGGSNGSNGGGTIGGTGSGANMRAFGESSGSYYGGGGGGGGGAVLTMSTSGLHVALLGGSGGSSGGGEGARDIYSAKNGADNTGGGGGGGGGLPYGRTEDDIKNGGKGGSGVVIIRWTHK